MIGQRVTITHRSNVNLGQLARVTGTIVSLENGKVTLDRVTGLPSGARVTIPGDAITACTGKALPTDAVTCPNCQARLDMLVRLGIEATRLWQVGNRDGQWRGCAAYHSAQGRTVLCVARPVEQTWRDLLSLAPGARS